MSLHEACMRGNLEEVKKYASDGVDLNMLDQHGSTPLEYASNRGHLEIVKFLVKEQGIPVNNADGDSLALFNAIKNNKLEVVRYLIEEAKASTQTDKKGVTPLMRAFVPLRQYRELIIYFVEGKFSDINAQQEQGFTALHFAWTTGVDMDIFQLLKDNGADPNIKDNEGRTAEQLSRPDPAQIAFFRNRYK